MVVFVDANRILIIFISIQINRDKFEGGFAIVKRSTVYSSEAALANWFDQLEWKAATLFITSQIVRTAGEAGDYRPREIVEHVRPSTVELGTWEIARKLPGISDENYICPISGNIFGVTLGLKFKMILINCSIN